MSAKKAGGKQRQWKGPAIGVRTKNGPEIIVCAGLERDGWTVVKRGWPDFLAWRGHEIRFIEVKRKAGYRLRRSQAMVAKALKTSLGITVEVLSPETVSK